MRSRIVEKCRELRWSLWGRRQRRRDARRETLPVLRGNMRRALVVKPDDPMFAEALFVLRDDSFNTPGVSREELLAQAKAAAEEYTAAALPYRSERSLSRAALFLSGAAVSLLLLWLCGVI